MELTNHIAVIRIIPKYDFVNSALAIGRTRELRLASVTRLSVQTRTYHRITRVMTLWRCAGTYRPAAIKMGFLFEIFLNLQ